MNRKEKVLEIISSIYGIESTNLDESKRLNEDLGGDSIDNFDLHFRLEKAFNIRIPDADADAFVTVGDVIDTIENIT